MNINIPNTLGLLEPHFLSRDRPVQRLARATESFLDTTEGWPSTLQTLTNRSATTGLAVMQVVLHDGYSVMERQQAWGLFNPVRTIAVSAWQFAAYREQQVFDLLQMHLTRIIEHIGATHAPGTLTCFLLPADPVNGRLMIQSYGLSCFGAVPSAILVQMWPDAGSLRKLGPCLARMVVHNVRYSYGPVTTLRDYLVLEGLAAHVVSFFTRMYISRGSSLSPNRMAGTQN